MFGVIISSVKLIFVPFFIFTFPYWVLYVSFIGLFVTICVSCPVLTSSFFSSLLFTLLFWLFSLFEFCSVFASVCWFSVFFSSELFVSCVIFASSWFILFIALISVPIAIWAYLCSSLFSSLFCSFSKPSIAGIWLFIAFLYICGVGIVICVSFFI